MGVWGVVGFKRAFWGCRWCADRADHHVYHFLLPCLARALEVLEAGAEEVKVWYGKK